MSSEQSVASFSIIEGYIYFTVKFKSNQDAGTFQYAPRLTLTHATTGTVVETKGPYENDSYQLVGGSQHAFQAKSSGSTALKFDISNLSNGLYYVTSTMYYRTSSSGSFTQGGSTATLHFGIGQPFYWCWHQKNVFSNQSEPATAQEILTAYTAMGGTNPSRIWQSTDDWQGAKGSFSNFSHKVWNEMLEFVNLTLRRRGQSWTGTYPNKSSGQILRATDLQALRINMQKILDNLNAGITLTYKSPKLDPDPGDPVLSSVFLAWLGQINYGLAKDYEDTIDILD